MEGTGIGLALVNELVRLHGGMIDVQSRLGEGTAMRVTLPSGFSHLPADQVSQEPDHMAPTGVAAASFVAEAMRWLPDGGQPSREDSLLDPTSPLIDEAGASHSEGQRSYVLLADDNADMREYARRLLNPQYEVKVVADGKAALQAMQERRPDLLLSDVMMPRLDGFGLLTATRADPALRDLPVILFSARAGDEARVEGLDAGADDYLVKPFAARELLARVRSNLDLARMRRAAAEQIREEARRLLECQSCCGAHWVRG